tara:strand:+ start:10511 stop:10690 length:180 start_codon:yes stop_codon:yes gene_type:complete
LKNACVKLTAFSLSNCLQVNSTTEKNREALQTYKEMPESISGMNASKPSFSSLPMPLDA